MKKTLLALAMATNALTFGASASELVLKPVLSPADKAAYEQLEELSGNTELVQNFHDIMEGQNEFKQGENESDDDYANRKTDAMSDLIKGVQENVSEMNNRDKAAAFVALNNISVFNDNPLTPKEEGYDSVLDQLINSFLLGGDVAKQRFNEWNSKTGKEKKEFISQKAGRGVPVPEDGIPAPIKGDTLLFQEDVPVVCGAEITQKNTGSIHFLGEIDVSSERSAQVITYSNAPTAMVG